MKTEIFLGSFHMDVGWCQFCLRSIKKFASGFAGVTLYIPERDRTLFDAMLRAPGLPAVKLATFNEYARKPMLSHELALCYAEKYCPDADFILHLDSDCIFTEPVTPEDYFVDGKPVLLCTPFSMWTPGLPWKYAAEAALGIPIEWETMCRHPAVHYRDLYPSFRAHVAKTVGRNFDEYVISCRDEFPQTFAEFTSLGNFAKAFWNDKYHWIHMPADPRPHDKVRQFWSRGGFTEPVLKEMNAVLG